jgi:hypothetical protein
VLHTAKCSSKPYRFCPLCGPFASCYALTKRLTKSCAHFSHAGSRLGRTVLLELSTVHASGLTAGTYAKQFAYWYTQTPSQRTMFVYTTRCDPTGNLPLHGRSTHWIFCFDTSQNFSMSLARLHAFVAHPDYRRERVRKYQSTFARLIEGFCE